MHIVFYSTSHVFETEERLNEKGINCKIVPTPVTTKHTVGYVLKLTQRMWKALLRIWNTTLLIRKVGD